MEKKNAHMNKLLQMTVLAALPAAAGALTSQDLAGDWCYSHVEIDGERQDLNVTFIFDRDGTYRFQHTPDSPVDKTGTYHINGDRIDMEPTFMAYDARVKSETGYGFVVAAGGDHVFVRGRCH